MKRPFIARRVSKLKPILALLVLLPLVSCSWLSNRKSLFEAEEAPPVQATPSSETVSKAEFERLQAQYQELSERHRLLQNELKLQEVDPNLLGQLREAKQAPELAETVDVFSPQVGGPQIQNSTTTRPIIDAVDVDSSLVEEQILILRNSSKLISENRFDEALREIKKIENSPLRQIRVRAKFNLGEMLFVQGEFDLAMQIFEDIIKTEAFSGVVLKTLGRLIVCSEKLNLEQKKESYYSILHDFFEQD